MKILTISIIISIFAFMTGCAVDSPQQDEFFLKLLEETDNNATDEPIRDVIVDDDDNTDDQVIELKVKNEREAVPLPKYEYNYKTDTMAEIKKPIFPNSQDIKTNTIDDPDKETDVIIWNK